MGVPAIVISAVDRSSLIFPASIAFNTMLGARGTASFVINDKTGAYNPAVGSPIGIYDNGVIVFGGSIDSKEIRRLGNTGGLTITCQCTSHEHRLDKRIIPSAVYKAMTAGDIVSDILTNFAAGEAIFAGTITAGITVDKVVYDYTRVSQALDDLAALCNFVWYVSPDNYLNFIPRSTFTAPFTLTNAKVLYLSHVDRQTREDFRDRQHIRVNFAAFAAVVESLDGNGVMQNFTLTRAINRVDSIVLSTSVRAYVDGTFTGLPLDNEPIALNGVVYRFKTVVDNTQANDVLIGATASDCATNLWRAINDNGYFKGTSYSWPTSAHPNCDTPISVGSTITARYRIGGVVGNGIVVSESLSNFTWTASSMSGGVDGTDTAQDIGILGVDSLKPWYCSPGEATITQQSTDPPMASGTFLSVTYRALGADVMTVEDTALIAARAVVEDGSGLYEHLIDDSQNTSAVAALAKAQSILDTYKAIPQTLDFETYSTGLRAGQLLPVSLTGPTISGNYLIESVDCRCDGRQFTYSAKALDGSRIGTWLQFWESLAQNTDSGGASSLSAIPAIAPATPAAPGNVTGISAVATYYTDKITNVRFLQFAIAYTAPSVLNDFSLVHIWYEQPDTSSHPVTALGTSTLGSSNLSGDWAPIDGGVFPSKAGAPAILKGLLPVDVATDFRVYVVAASKAVDPPLVRATDASPSPSVVVTVNPPGAGISGEEYARVVTGFTAAVGKEPLTNGEQGYYYYGSWTNPADDVNFTGAVIEEDIGGVKFADLADEKEGSTSFKTRIWGIPADGISARIIAFSYNADRNGRRNSFIDGLTPYVDVTVARVPDGPGIENCALVTGFTAVAVFGFDTDGGEIYGFTGAWTPAADYRYGGAKIYAHNLTSGAVSPLTGYEPDTLHTSMWPIKDVVTYDLYAVSADKANRENTLIDGITPKVATIVVGPQTTGKIKINRVDPALLAPALAILSSKLDVALLGVDTSRLGALSVDNSKLQALIVTAAEMANTTITSGKYGLLSVGTGAFALLAVGSAQIQNLGVDNAKINDLQATKVTAGTFAGGIVYAGVVATSQLSAGTIAVAITLTAPTIVVSGSGTIVDINTTDLIKVRSGIGTGAFAQLTQSGLHVDPGSGVAAVFRSSGVTCGGALFDNLNTDFLRLYPYGGGSIGFGINIGTTYTAGSATAGIATLPSNPASFLIVTIGGGTFKIPYYN